MDQELAFCNGRTFPKLNIQMITETDVSLTAGDESAIECKEHGNGQKKK